VVWRTREVSTDGSTTSAGIADVRDSDSGITVELQTGINRRPNMRTTARLTTAPVQEGAAVQDQLTFDVLATSALLGRAGLSVGDEASVRIGGLRATARIAGVAPVSSVAADERFALLADRRTLATVEYTTLGTTQSPDQWAIATGADTNTSVVATLDSPPLDSTTVLDRRLDAEQRTRDPVLVGLTGSLFAAVLAAAVVAVLGLALTAVTEARSRRGDYAVLRALGARRAELRGWLVRETIPLAVVSIAAGVVTGLVLASLTVRSLTSDRDGSAAIPEPTVVVPWPVVAALVMVVVAAVIALPMLTSRLLRGTKPADELRIGDAR
ncbi:MAG: FtsX-like permease family protein, partial [Ilumatobacteraceae bacterium]